MACKEKDVDREEGNTDGSSVGGGTGRARGDADDGDREGGSELRSGAISSPISV